jgi:hypothetical protein
MGVGFIGSATGSAKTPGELRASAIAAGLYIISGLSPSLNRVNISEAEFRAKYYAAGSVLPKTVDMRTPAEGGTFVHNGTTQLIITGIAADKMGCSYQFQSAAAGRWFFAWKIKNSLGFSNWTDGDEAPQYVERYVDTDLASLVDAGAAADWNLLTIPGRSGDTFYFRVTRPETNGLRIKRVIFQLMDDSVGTWRALDANLGEAVTLYDGSAVSHTYNPINGTITKAAGNYGTAAANGGLALVDIRGSAFNQLHCQWIMLDPEQFNGNIISGVHDLVPQYAPVAGEWLDIRLRIVKPPNQWAANGYSAFDGIKILDFTGNPEGADTESGEFTSPVFRKPAGVTLGNIAGRAWFQNDYSISDNNDYGASYGSAPPISSELPVDQDYSDFTNGSLWERHPVPDTYITQTQENGKATFQAAVGAELSSDAHVIPGYTFKPILAPDENGFLDIRCTVNVINKGTNIVAGSAGIAAGLFISDLGNWAGQSAQLQLWGIGQRQATHTMEGLKMVFEAIDDDTPINFVTVTGGIVAAGTPIEIRFIMYQNSPPDTGNFNRWGTDYYSGGWVGFNPGVNTYRSVHSVLRGIRAGVCVFADTIPTNFHAEITNFEINRGIVALPFGGNVTINYPAPVQNPAAPRTIWDILRSVGAVK